MEFQYYFSRLIRVLNGAVQDDPKGLRFSQLMNVFKNRDRKVRVPNGAGWGNWRLFEALKKVIDAASKRRKGLKLEGLIRLRASLDLLKNKVVSQNREQQTLDELFRLLYILKNLTGGIHPLIFRLNEGRDGVTAEDWVGRARQQTAPVASLSREHAPIVAAGIETGTDDAGPFDGNDGFEKFEESEDKRGDEAITEDASVARSIQYPADARRDGESAHEEGSGNPEVPDNTEPEMDSSEHVDPFGEAERIDRPPDGEHVPGGAEHADVRRAHPEPFKDLEGEERVGREDEYERISDVSDTSSESDAESHLPSPVVTGPGRDRGSLVRCVGDMAAAAILYALEQQDVVFFVTNIPPRDFEAFDDSMCVYRVIKPGEVLKALPEWAWRTGNLLFMGPTTMSHAVRRKLLEMKIAGALMYPKVSFFLCGPEADDKGLRADLDAVI
jgi:hypothetical protein